MCTALRTLSVLSHPPGMKPQRPPTWNHSNSCRMHPHNIHSQHIQKTHTNMHIWPNNVGKLLCYINNGKCLYFKRYSLSSLSSSSLLYFSTPPSKWDMKSLFTWGPIPPGSSTLFNYNWWLSSPTPGSRSQSILALNPILSKAFSKAWLPWLTSLSI